MATSNRFFTLTAALLCVAVVLSSRIPTYHPPADFEPDYTLHEFFSNPEWDSPPGHLLKHDLLTGPSTQWIDWVSKDPKVGKAKGDITNKYEKAYASLEEDISNFPTLEAQKYHYVLVAGLFTDHYPFYFDCNVKAIKAVGLDVDRVNMSSDDPISVNAKKIRDTVIDINKRTGKKIVLIGHSKGCIDAGDMFNLHPETIPLVRSFISMQGPYAGSPMATDVTGSGPVHWIVSKLISGILGGNPKALEDMQYSSRKKFIDANPYPSQVPTLSLITKSERVSSFMYPTMEYMMKSYGVENDGLVAEIDAVFPGSLTVYLENTDHGDTVFDVFTFRKYDPKTLQQALIWLSLTEM